MISKLRILRNPLRRFCSNLHNDLMNDYLEEDHQQYNRHIKKVNLYNFEPITQNICNISPTAVLIGEVMIETESFVGNFSVIRGDLNAVKIEQHAIITENCSVSTVSELDKTGQEAMTYISTECMIMPGANLISSDLERGVTVGANSVVCEGSKLGEFAVIGANSVVPPYRYIPGHQLWTGNPVRFVKDLSKQEVTSVRVYKKFLIKSKYSEVQDDHFNNTAFIQKKELDDIEIILKDHNVTLEELEETLAKMKGESLHIYMDPKIVELAQQRVAQLKARNQESITESVKSS